MTSLKGQMINFLLRYNYLFRGKLKKEMFDFDTSINAFRERCEKGAKRFGKLPTGIRIEEDIISDIKSEWIIPSDSNKNKLIFYVHGGGYVSGSCNDHRAVVSKIAHITGITTLHFEYRLAPEFPFPHALNDSMNVFQEILKRGFHHNNIVIMGESAGGGLALALLLAFKQNKIPVPKAVVAISPWTDLSCSGSSYQTKNKLSVAPLNSWKVFSKYYVGEEDAGNPLISPLFGDLIGLPPVFINSAENDELFDDGKRFYEKAKESGVDVKFKAGHGMIHCYPLLAPMFREAAEAIDEIVNFIKTQLNE